MATVLEWRPGVIYVAVPPDTKGDAIERLVLTEITGYQLSIFNLKAAAKRVLWWHALFMPVTVVLSAKERLPDASQAYAGITGAARTLSDEYGITTIIDVSDNSAPSNRLETARAAVLRMEPIDRDTLESIPEFQDLLTALKGQHLDEGKSVLLHDAVWHTLGGVPVLYEELQRKWGEAGSKPEALRTAVLKVLADRFGKALGHIIDAIAENKSFAEFYVRFQTEDYVSKKHVKELGLQQTTPDKVLRLVQVELDEAKGLQRGISGAQVLVPATPTVGFVLRYCFKEVPSVEQLRDAILQAVAKEQAAKAAKAQQQQEPSPGA